MKPIDTTDTIVDNSIPTGVVGEGTPSSGTVATGDTATGTTVTTTEEHLSLLQKIEADVHAAGHAIEHVAEIVVEDTKAFVERIEAAVAALKAKL